MDSTASGQKELQEICEKITFKIDSFEKQCINKKRNLEEYRVKFKTIEKILKDEDSINLEMIKVIENEELRLIQCLLQNKTIFFMNVSFLEESKRELIDRKLVVLNDEFISKKTFLER